MEEAQEKPFNIYEIVFKYLVYWPWFIISVIVCLAAAFVYLRYSTPVYSVYSTVLIKETDPRSKISGSNALMAVNLFEYQDNANVNHEVVIVGWDDHYPKENFSATLAKLSSVRMSGYSPMRTVDGTHFTPCILAIGTSLMTVSSKLTMRIGSVFT